MILVYFAYLMPGADWWVIIGDQMRDVIKSGILEASSLEVVLSGSPGDTTECLRRLRGLLGSTPFHSTESQGNTFEYPGIHRLWEVAQGCADDEILVYIHSKGMSHHRIIRRSPDEARLTRHTLSRWREIPALMIGDVSKIGLFPCENHGWIWFNFFYIRASHLKASLEPRLSMNDRYYYESYIGTDYRGSRPALTWSLFANNGSSTGFVPNTAWEGLHSLPL